MAAHDPQDPAGIDDGEERIGNTAEDPSAVPAADSAPDDGGDMAGSRDPDEIAEEIEQTRAELADTIDAIAERISPKRAASRGAQAVKAQVSSARDKVTGDSSGGLPSADGSPTDAMTSAPELPVGRIAAVAAVLVMLAIIVRRRKSR
jgi:hypothetical protein